MITREMKDIQHSDVLTSRYIHNRDLSSADGLAIDEAVCEFCDQGKSPSTLHLYNYVPSVILGRYQNAAASLRLDECDRRGIEVNRRITGGGTVFMTPEQMALGLVLPNNFPELPQSIKGVFQFLAAIFADALSNFGLKAEFMGKNDLTVGGRKIAGLAISRDRDNVTFLHTSLLLDFDIATMLEILNLPRKGLLDRGVSCFGQRMTTIRQEAKSKISLEEIQEAVLNSMRKMLNLELPETELSEEEKARVEDLKEKQYEDDEWIYAARSPKRKTVTVEQKTPGGLLQVHLAQSGGAIESIMITGDYFSRTRDIVMLESILKWTAATPDSIRKKLQECRAETFIHRVDMPVILTLITGAIEGKP